MKHLFISFIAICMIAAVTSMVTRSIGPPTSNVSLSYSLPPPATSLQLILNIEDPLSATMAPPDNPAPFMPTITVSPPKAPADIGLKTFIIKGPERYIVIQDIPLAPAINACNIRPIRLLMC